MEVKGFAMADIASRRGLRFGLRPWYRFVLLAAMSIFPCWIAGCQSNAPGTDEISAEEAAASAFAVLQEMANRYRGAKTYADSGDAFFSATRLGETTTDQPIPFSSTFQRPGKARLHLFDAGIVIDGKDIWATVRHVPGQIIRQKAPRSFVLELLPQDVILAEAMHRGLPLLRPLPMLLLTNPDALEILLEGASPPESLADGETAGRACFRVQIKRPTNNQVLWIDKESYVLRRIDFSGADIQRRLNPDGQLTDLKVWIEFTGAQLNPEFKTNPFEFEAPPEARLVKQLVAPVLAPPPALGQKVGDFTLYSDQDTLHRADVIDRVTVFCFWNTGEESSRGILPELEMLATKYKGSPEVRFFAVSADPSVVKTEKVLQTLRSWGSSLPLLRDPDGAGRADLFVKDLPAVIVVGGDARIHEAQAGLPFDVGAVDRAIAGLLGGNDVARNLLEQYIELNARFQTELEKVALPSDTVQIEVPQSVIAPRSEPRHLKLEKLWSSSDLKEPGNILVIPTPSGPSRAIVFDGWRTLVELGPTGETIGRHELDISPNSIASYLRTAVDGEGKRWFVASSVNQQQLFLIDENFEVKLSYPDERHPGIADVQLADLAGDGKLAIVVGFWGAVGVQGVSFEGERLWSNRSVENVLQVVIGSADERGEREALCYSTRGTLLPLNARGEAAPEIRIPAHTLTNLAGEDVNGDGKIEICAIAIDPKNLGHFTAIGLDETGKELWNYELPTGNHSYVVERIIPARLGANDGGWLLPGADGSIQLLTVTGELVDRFHYGAAITGLGLAQFDGVPVLLVSTPDSCSAWKLLPADKP
jgi:outer membrane lipoprotein-sorting protein